MKILIIRHAEPDYEHDTLTEKGFREAEYLGKYLTNKKIDRILSSPIPRSHMTAEETAKRKNMEIETVDWLHEFRGGMIDENGNRRIPWNLAPRFWMPLTELYDYSRWDKEEHIVAGGCDREYSRVCSSFDEMMAGYGYTHDGLLWHCKKNLDLTVALFCHLGLGLTLVSHLTAISPVLLLHTMFLPTSSVTTFVTEERVPNEVVFKCMQLGDTSHLAVAGEPVSTSGLFPEFAGGSGEGAKL